MKGQAYLKYIVLTVYVQKGVCTEEKVEGAPWLKEQRRSNYKVDEEKGFGAVGVQKLESIEDLTPPLI